MLAGGGGGDELMSKYQFLHQRYTTTQKKIVDLFSQTKLKYYLVKIIRCLTCLFVRKKPENYASMQQFVDMDNGHCVSVVNDSESAGTVSTQSMRMRYCLNLKSGRSLILDWDILCCTLIPIIKYQQQGGPVERFSFFSDFRNGHIAVNWRYFHEFNSKKSVKFAMSPKSARATKFYFSKNHSDRK